MLDRKGVLRWNDEKPHWVISPDAIGTSTDRLGTPSIGSEVFVTVDLLRNKQAPIEDWSGIFREFYEEFTEWKEENNLFDFTDLLEKTYSMRAFPPHSPSVIFADEVQDFSTLEMALLMWWGKSVDHLVMVGDLFQSIFSFRGASKLSLDGSVAAVLDQSYRIPRTVHQVAENIMSLMEDLEPVSFKPRDHEGEVIRTSSGYRDFEAFIPRIEEETEAGRSVMVVASCAYMLGGALKKLRARGVPFWNPYTKKGPWNPLTPTAERGQVPMMTRLRTFLRAFDDDRRASIRWNPHEVAIWLPLFSGIVKRGGAKMVRSWDKYTKDEELIDNLFRIFKDDVVDELYEGHGPWSFLLKYAKDGLIPRLEYVKTCIDARGVGVLDENPRLIMGTIHSVKGGEADTVIVFPDLSSEGYENYTKAGWDGREATLRLFYVGVTRARDRLILAGPSGGNYVSGF